MTSGTQDRRLNGTKASAES